MKKIRKMINYLPLLLLMITALLTFIAFNSYTVDASNSEISIFSRPHPDEEEV